MLHRNLFHPHSNIALKCYQRITVYIPFPSFQNYAENYAVKVTFLDIRISQFRQAIYSESYFVDPCPLLPLCERMLNSPIDISNLIWGMKGLNCGSRPVGVPTAELSLVQSDGNATRNPR
jgi:hypothetical protein